MCNRASDDRDSLSLPIVDRKYVFNRCITLKDISADEDDTGIHRSISIHLNTFGYRICSTSFSLSLNFFLLKLMQTLESTSLSLNTSLTTSLQIQFHLPDLSVRKLLRPKFLLKSIKNLKILHWYVHILFQNMHEFIYSATMQCLINQMKVTEIKK